MSTEAAKRIVPGAPPPTSVSKSQKKKRRAAKKEDDAPEVSLSDTPVAALTEKAHIYLTTNGRISMAGLNSHNVEYFAESLDKVVRGQL